MNPRRNDVAWEFDDKGNVALLEGVIYQEGGKVGAGEDCDLSACAFKVGNNGIFLLTFVHGDEDVAECGGAGGRGDAEDDV